MLVIPAIDIKDGKCVRLKQGHASQETVYSTSPLQTAREFVNRGAKRLHIVDLNDTLENLSNNKSIINEIAMETPIPIQIGGGIRTLKQVQDWLDNGLNSVIIGTLAITDFELTKQALQNFGPDRIIVALDARDGLIAINGWKTQTKINAIELGKKLKKVGLKRVLYTDIMRDGMMQGPNLSATKNLAAETGLKVTASGGISRKEDVDALRSLERFGVDSVVVGRAFYENRILPEEVL